MPLTFPYPATTGQTYTDSNGAVWQYDGIKWDIVTGTTKRLYNGVKVGLSINYSVTTTLAPVNWDVEFIDTDGYWNSLQPSRITIPATGYYNLNTNVFSDNSGAGYELQILKNGTTEITDGLLNPNQAADYNETVFFNQGDYIQLLISEYTDVGAVSSDTFMELTLIGLALGTGVNSNNAFSGVKTSIGFNFATTVTPAPLAWDGTVFDTNANALALTYWTVSDPGKITVKMDGYYQISAFVETATVGGTYTITLRKNGSINVANATIAPNDTANIDQVYQLNNGDYLELLVSDTSGTGAITTETYLEAIRMGV